MINTIEELYMIIITRTRPSVDVNFFRESLPESVQLSMQEYNTQNNVTFTVADSKDGLTRIAVFDMSEEEFTNYVADFNKKFVTYVATRGAYQKENGITEKYAVT